MSEPSRQYVDELRDEIKSLRQHLAEARAECERLTKQVAGGRMEADRLLNVVFARDAQLAEARAALRDGVDLIDAEDLNRSAFTKWAKRAAEAGVDRDVE